MPNWKPKVPVTIGNIGALPKLQELFNKYDIRPTYLITYPVASEDLGIETLRSLLKQKNCEIGTHFHPWTTPPIHESEIQSAIFPFKLEKNLHRAKLINLTNSIKKSFNIEPKSYRAGRFGFDKIGLKLIEELGYNVDTSVTPLTNWGSDFRGATSTPYFLDYEDLTKQGQSNILEVPVSIDIDLHKYFKSMYAMSSEKVKGALKYFGVKRNWLRPSLSSTNEMIKLSGYLIKNNVKILNMMFHSSELTTTGSPFNKTEIGVRNYFNKLEEYFKFIKKGEINPLTLSEFRKTYIKENLT